MDVHSNTERGGSAAPAVDRTVELLRDSFPHLVEVRRSTQLADDGHEVVVLHAVSRASSDDVRRAYYGFLPRWDAAVPAEQRRYLRVVFAVAGS